MGTWRLREQSFGPPHRTKLDATRKESERPSFAPVGQSLAARLGRRLDGEVRVDDLTRGLYATDASLYQIPPIAVVFPQHVADVVETLRIATDVGVPVVPRGAGTSQSGQARPKGSCPIGPWQRP